MQLVVRILMVSLVALPLKSHVAHAQIEPNAKFPEVSLMTLDGKKKFDMKTLKGKVAIVDFWAQWCEPCLISMPFLQEMAKKYKGKLVVVGINVDEDAKLANDFLKEHPAPNIKMLSDSKNEFAKTAKLSTMPTSFLVDKKGVVRLKHEGFREDDKARIEKEIQKLIKGK
ncbi:MAG: TlpA family protein disulfide reductase [Bdellovibrionaceae bacterium]|nr:TlpA family protein disulfide reductase [Pseudobdellovibrionaceae bacterium]